MQINFNEQKKINVELIKYKMFPLWKKKDFKGYEILKFSS